MTRFFSTILAVSFLMLFTVDVLAQQGTAKATKHSVDVRDGTGSYFDLVARLQRDVPVMAFQEEEGWVFIRFSGKEGWVPASALVTGSRAGTQQPNVDADDIRRRMEGAMGQASGRPVADEQIYASPAQVAAAVKGFARRYKTRRGETVVDLTDNFDRRFNARDYRQFRQDRISLRDLRRLERRFPIITDTIPDLNADIDETGWGIANVLAQGGLYHNRELQVYLNYIALMVAEASHRHEVPVQVHILDSDEILGYAVPGGIIFVSKGALRAMRSEAEFANFVGHEIAHIVLLHGMIEMEERRPRILSSRASGRLDQALLDAGHETDELTEMQQALSSRADEIFEYMIQGRLEAYEFESDYWGMVYAARAGYNATTAVQYLQRMLQSQGDFGAMSERGGLEWSGTSINARIIALNQSMSRQNFQGGNTREADWQRMMNRMR